MWRLTLRSSISRPRRCHPNNRQHDRDLLRTFRSGRVLPMEQLHAPADAVSKPSNLDGRFLNLKVEKMPTEAQ